MKRTALAGRPALWLLLVALGMLAAGGLILNMESTKPLAGGIRAAAALFFVLGVLFLASHLVKKYSSRLGGVVPNARTPIEVKGTKGIGPGRWLMVVEVARESFLISSGKEGVSLLARLSPNGEDPDGEGAE